MDTRNPPLPALRHRRRRAVVAVAAVAVAAGIGIGSDAGVIGIIGIPAARAADAAPAQPEPVARFERIDIDVAADVRYRVGARTAVAVEAPAHVRERIRVQSTGGTLRITTSGSWSTDRPVRILIEGPATLAAAQVRGATALTLAGLRADAFALDAVGSAQVTVAQGRWQRFVAKLDDSAEAEADGTADELRLEARGSSHWQGGRFAADVVTATTQDSATATVQGRRTIDARASEASSIHTRGSATVRRQVSDAASVDSDG